MAAKPKVSVLMPVYNGEKYLEEAIKSILTQTFTDFEFIIINDGSSDNTKNIIKSFNDPRIRLINNKKNLGLPASLNIGIEHAKGEYIARMDADDISLPNRLKKQVTFMDIHPATGVCGTWIKIHGEKKDRIKKQPISHEEICAKMFYKTPFGHPTVIIRKEVFLKNNLRYDESFLRSQDYKLWTEMVKVTRFANIPEVLYYQRKNRSATKKMIKNPEQRHELRNKVVESFLDRPLTNHERKCHEALYFVKPFHDLETIAYVKEWVEYLKETNKLKNVFVEPMFSDSLDYIKNRMLKNFFYHSINQRKRFAPDIIHRLFFSNEKYYRLIPAKKVFSLCVKSLIMSPNKRQNNH